MVALTTHSRAEAAHIRPFQVHRDLAGLATLIEVAFGEDLVLTGSRMVQDMRRFALLGPVLRLARPTLPMFVGYVWIEGEKLVGNVNIVEEDRRSGTWTLSNVAVLPEYRGRGIGGRLVETAIAHVRRCHGSQILLQVRQDNDAACALYARRGFVTFDTWYEMDLPTYGWIEVLDVACEPLRRPRARDAQHLLRLASRSTLPGTLQRHPLRYREFRRGAGWHLARFADLALHGRETIELVGEADGQLVAYGRIKTRLMGGPHELGLFVDPAYRGPWEASLLQGLLELAGGGRPRQRVRTSVSIAHAEALEALSALGFQTLRVLDQMALDLR